MAGQAGSEPPEFAGKFGFFEVKSFRIAPIGFEARDTPGEIPKLPGPVDLFRPVHEILCWPL
jgi:hypothetical protein